MGRWLRGDGEIISSLVDIRFVTDQIALNNQVPASCFLRRSFFNAATSLNESYSSSFSLRLSLNSFLQFLASKLVSSFFIFALLSALPFSCSSLCS
jgi:hypothetical protein